MNAATSSGAAVVAKTSSIAASVVARAASGPPIFKGYGYGTCCTPPMSGSKWARYFTVDEVSAIAP